MILIAKIFREARTEDDKRLKITLVRIRITQ